LGNQFRVSNLVSDSPSCVRGGFHHCSGDRGGGFCPFADITLSYRLLRQNFPDIKKVMIVDLDAHQGNGHARDKLSAKDNDVYILDMYNKYIYPGDQDARPGINTEVLLKSGTKDDEYLAKLQEAMKTSFSAFEPRVIYYNAGTDICMGDPLGRMNVTSEGIKKRDEIVFDWALQRKIPIVMLLSGGYQKSNAQIIAESITNLKEKFAIFE